MSLSNLDLFNIRTKLEQKRYKASQDAFQRDQRSKILNILYIYVPKQKDNLKRTEAINEITDRIMKICYGGQE